MIKWTGLARGGVQRDSSCKGTALALWGGDVAQDIAEAAAARRFRATPARGFFVDNLLVRIHLIMRSTVDVVSCNLKKGIQTPMAQGRSTQIKSVLRWIRTRWSSMKNSLSHATSSGEHRESNSRGAHCWWHTLAQSMSHSRLEKRVSINPVLA